MASSIRGEVAGENHFSQTNRPPLILKTRLKTLAAANRWATLKLPLRTGALFFLFERRASADPEKLSCAGSADIFYQPRESSFYLIAPLFAP
jgi:hypothetical protein